METGEKDVQYEIETVQAQIEALKKELPRAKTFSRIAMILDMGSFFPVLFTFIIPKLNFMLGIGLIIAMTAGAFILKRVGGDSKKVEAKINALENKIVKLKRQNGDDPFAVQATAEEEKKPLSPEIKKKYAVYRYLPCIISAVFAVCVFIGFALPLSVAGPYSLYGMLKNLITKGVDSVFNFSGNSVSKIFLQFLNPAAFLLLTFFCLMSPLSSLFYWKKKSPAQAKKNDKGAYITYGLAVFFAVCYFYVYNQKGTRAGAFPVMLLIVACLAIAATVAAMALRTKFEKKNNIVEEI